MKGRIACEKNAVEFRDVRQLVVLANEKLWCFKGGTEEELVFTSCPLSALEKVVLRVDGKLWVAKTADGSTLRFEPAPKGVNGGFGSYLKKWRKREVFTQAEAAEELGVSQAMIARIEKGARGLNPRIFIKIREYNKRHYGFAEPKT